MAKYGFIGAALGTGLAIAAAPFTAGASLGLLAAGGALAGATLGSQIDSTKAASKANKIANAQLEENKVNQAKLKTEKARVDDIARREKTKIDQGIARALRRKYKKPEGFLNAGNEKVSGVLG